MVKNMLDYINYYVFEAPLLSFNLTFVFSYVWFNISFSIMWLLLFLFICMWRYFSKKWFYKLEKYFKWVNPILDLDNILNANKGI
jgi:hypothetical protein